MQTKNIFAVYWSGGFVIIALAFVRFLKSRVPTTKNQLELEPGFRSIVPNRVTEVPEEKYESDEEDENDIEAPFAPKKSGWFHFITKHFGKKQPPIDKTMLALHISAMSLIHKAKFREMLKSHTPIDDTML